MVKPRLHEVQCPASRAYRKKKQCFLTFLTEVIQGIMKPGNPVECKIKLKHKTTCDVLSLKCSWGETEAHHSEVYAKACEIFVEPLKSL